MCVCACDMRTVLFTVDLEDVCQLRDRVEEEKEEEERSMTLYSVDV